MMLKVSLPALFALLQLLRLDHVRAFSSLARGRPARMAAPLRIATMEAASSSSSVRATTASTRPPKPEFLSDSSSIGSSAADSNGVKKTIQRLWEILPFRRKLAKIKKMGLSAVFSYQFVSSINTGIAIPVAWYAFVKRTGLSPLAPGEWKTFLAFYYTGFFVFNNLIRPLKIALTVLVVPYFDKLAYRLQDRFCLSKNKAAVVLGVTGQFVGSCIMVPAGIGLASMASGVPIWSV